MVKAVCKLYEFRWSFKIDSNAVITFGNLIPPGSQTVLIGFRGSLLNRKASTVPTLTLTMANVRSGTFDISSTKLNPSFCKMKIPLKTTNMVTSKIKNTIMAKIIAS